MKSLWYRRLLGIPIGIILVLILGIAVYAANYIAHSSVTGSITVNQYVPPVQTPIYGATVSPVDFTSTATANSGGTASIDLTGTITVTDTSTNGELSQVTGIDVSGNLPVGLTLIPDPIPIAFVNRTAIVHVRLTGALPAGTYNLSTGSPMVNINCN